jgi:hypothetical protein
MRVIARCRQLLVALKRIEWPKARYKSIRSHSSDSHVHQDFQRKCSKLLALQMLSLPPLSAANLDDDIKALKSNTHSVWAIECLLQPIDTRFAYHFQTPTVTNRLDKVSSAHRDAESIH